MPCCTIASSPGSVVNCSNWSLSSSFAKTTSSAPTLCSERRWGWDFGLRYLYPIGLSVIKACTSFEAGQDHPLFLKHVGHPLLMAAATFPQCWIDETLQQPVPASICIFGLHSARYQFIHWLNHSRCHTCIIDLFLQRTSIRTAALPGPLTSHRNSTSKSPLSPFASFRAFSMDAFGTC